ncbi:ABC-2 family transporter protein [Planctomycetes bacterium CA13]|uniref:ABC-2 family transporter protein n=1 Tax=Novipirellula herctigrandis TaxID=2527986 RepID=A0A5C5Z747_9BACT|nr:ABC-2 family transporter protein [Planctomycetes bacterium CA13]
MNRLTMPWDVVRFELRRSFTPARMAMWLVLVAFPIAIIATMRTIANAHLADKLDPADFVEPFGVTLYFLVPEVTCLLGLLLWATPAISTEIEGQTWVYLALRRSGRRMVLFGKYLTAVIWTLSAALVAISASVFLIGTDVMLRMWLVMSALAVLSCLAHAAIFLLIGVVFYRRTMVAAVLYTMVVEYGLSFVPALVNKFTVNYRLRGLLATWMGWEDVRSNAENIFGSEPVSTHLLVLAAITITLLGAALYRVENAEYPTQQEG